MCSVGLPSRAVQPKSSAGIRSWHAVLGGSLGGARALEWAVSYPDRVRRCGVFSVGASSTAEQIAFAQAQTLAIRQDPNFNGGDYYGGLQPEAGLALARRHLGQGSGANQARTGAG